MSKANKNRATAPLVIESDNLSEAWAAMYLHVLDNPGKEIAPLVLTIDGFVEGKPIAEDQSVRTSLDRLLAKKGKTSVENVAFTIFPQRYWQIAGRDRVAFFKLYNDSFGRMQAMNRQLNGRGLYFQRMTMYGRGPCGGNQLEWIISQYNSRSGVRRSMLQATVFDAERDHAASAQLGFPCLQHVSFAPTPAGLVVNAFYATQQIFDKAYGNYLGLIQLGVFMAKELGMPLARLNVMVGVAKFERITKSDPDMAELISNAKSLVETGETPQAAS